MPGDQRSTQKYFAVPLEVDMNMLGFIFFSAHLKQVQKMTPVKELYLQTRGTLIKLLKQRKFQITIEKTFSLSQSIASEVQEKSKNL